MFFSCHFGVFTFSASILWVGRQELSKDIIPCKILLCWSLGIRPELEWRLEKVYRTTKHKHMYCGDGFNTFRQKTSDTMDQSRMNVHLSACNVPVPQTQFGVIYIHRPFTTCLLINCSVRLCRCTEPEYDFEKKLNDADAYEKETAEFECEVNDEEAPVQWFREDKVIRLMHALYSIGSLIYLDAVLTFQLQKQ